MATLLLILTMTTNLAAANHDAIRACINQIRQTPTLVIMDTEQVCWEDSLERRAKGEGPQREVIQLAAVTIDTQTFSEISSFEVMVKPVIYPQLSLFCTELTGITQERVDTEGLSFSEAYDKWLAYIGDQPVMVYRADEDVLRENLAMHNDTRAVGRFLKCRAMLETCGIDMEGVNSGKIAKTFGSTKHYREHDALADVRSMAEGWALLARLVGV